MHPLYSTHKKPFISRKQVTRVKKHIPFRIPWFIKFDVDTECEFYNKQYDFTNIGFYSKGKWKLLLTMDNFNVLIIEKWRVDEGI